MKNKTNYEMKNYTMPYDMMNTELDADILAVHCIMHDCTRMEDVVPALMMAQDWFAAKNYALAQGWIAKDPTGPTNRGARYIASNPLDAQIDEADLYEQLCESSFEYAIDQHLSAVKSLLQSYPNQEFNAWDLRRSRSGPCTNATWPHVKSQLIRMDEVETEGQKRATTYTFIPIQWRLEERILELESILNYAAICFYGVNRNGVDA